MPPSGNLSFEIVKGGEGGPIYATTNTPSWWPSWVYFSYGGSSTVSGSQYRYTSTITHSGNRLQVNSSAEQTGQTVALDYTYTAMDGPMSFTLIAHGFSAQKPFDGGTVTAKLAGSGTVTKALPTSRGSLNGVYDELSYTSPTGDVIRITISPVAQVTTEGRETRITLVGSSLAAGEVRSTHLVYHFDDSLHFYPDRNDSLVRTGTTGWFPYRVDLYGVPVDLSFLNRDSSGNYVPAGAHGFNTVAGENFAFEDGTPARFWGVNVTAGAALSNDTRAPEIADRLARLGVNFVRLHHLDSWANPIVDYGNPDNTTQNLNATNMARLDRTIYELKRRGIYVLIDAWVQRYFRSADGVAAWENFATTNSFHLHPYVFFDGTMGDKVRLLVGDVWKHTNPLTGLAYRDDPACATMETANEALMQRSANHTSIEPYRTNFLSLYEDWALANGGLTGIGDKIITQNYGENNLRFYIDVLDAFFQQTRNAYRAAGVRIPINGSNWFLWNWEIYANTGMDFMEAHHYYGGDQIGPGSGLGGLWVEHPPSVSDTPWGKLGAMAVWGKPINMSELGNNPPKTYRGAYGVGLAGVACLQGWDGLLGYAYSQSNKAVTSLSAYEWEADPVTMAAWAAGSLIYRRQDVLPANDQVFLTVNDAEKYTLHWENSNERAIHRMTWFNVALETHKTSVFFGDQAPAGVPYAETKTQREAFDYTHAGTEILSDTGEMWRDWAAGIGWIDTPRTQAAYGKLGTHGQPLATHRASFDITTPYATVVLSSLSRAPLDRASKLVLIATARAENTGRTANLALTSIVNSGSSPVICEPVVGTVTFPTNQTALTLYPLQADGTRQAGVAVPITNRLATVTLSGTYKTLFYEIEGATVSPEFSQWIQGFPKVPVNARGANDDSDGDGLSQLAEYFAGSRPDAADAAGAYTVTARDGKLVLRFRRDRQASVVFYVEWTDDLDSGKWHVVPASQLTVVDSTPDYDVIEASVNGSASRFFMRLRLEL